MMFGGIFSSGTVDKIINKVSGAYLSKEEKVKYSLDYLKHYEPFKLAQRYIAFSLIAYVLLIGLVGSILVLFGANELADKIIDFNERSIFDNSILKIILGFYFLGGVFNSYKKDK